MCTLWQELRVLERATVGIGARLPCTPRCAVPSWGGLPWEPNLVTARKTVGRFGPVSAGLTWQGREETKLNLRFSDSQSSIWQYHCE